MNFTISDLEKLSEAVETMLWVTETDSDKKTWRDLLEKIRAMETEENRFNADLHA